MAWTLVTPSSRGIGLALVQRLLRTTSIPVVATARADLPGVRERILSDVDPSSHSRLDVQQVDLLSESSIAELASYCKDRYNNTSTDKAAHLRLGFFLPGMLVPERSPSKIDATTALATLQLNLLAPMVLAKHFVPFLPRKSLGKLPAEGGLNASSAMLAIMSARVGSITDNAKGGWFSYRATKAGVNQLVKTLDLHLRMQNGDNAVAVGLHPGTVKTDLSKEFWAVTPKEKLFAPDFSAQKLLEVLAGLDTDGGRGRCWDWKGEEIPP